MGEVVSFRGTTKLDLDPDRILENTKGQLKHFVIVGYDMEDNFFFSSTMADGGDVLWIMEQARLSLFGL